MPRVLRRCKSRCAGVLVASERLHLFYSFFLCSFFRPSFLSFLQIVILVCSNNNANHSSYAHCRFVWGNEGASPAQERDRHIPSTRRNDRYVPKESDLTLQNSDTWFYQGRVGYRSLVRTFARFVPPPSSSSSSVFFVFFGFGILSETRSQTHTHTYTNTHTRAREHTRARTRARARGVSCNMPS